jgi:hypothetical protein
MELLTPYSLSRGAPSATRPSLLRYVPGYRPRYPALVRGRSPKTSRLDEVSPPATIALGPQPGRLGRALLAAFEWPLALAGLPAAVQHRFSAMLSAIAISPYVRWLPCALPIITACRANSTVDRGPSGLVYPRDGVALNQGPGPSRCGLPNEPGARRALRIPRRGRRVKGGDRGASPRPGGEMAQPLAELASFSRLMRS